MSLPQFCAGAAGSVAASTTIYYPIGQGFGGPPVNTTESWAQTAVRTATTYSLLRVKVTANNRATSTVRMRVNTANGNQSISVTGTGEYTDASNSDTVASGDLVNISVTTGSGGSSFIMPFYQLVSSADYYRYANAAFSGGATTGANVACYESLAGDWGSLAATTEAEKKGRFVASVTLREMAIVISANAQNAAATLITRKNGANGGQSVTIPSLTAGVFQDTSGTDSLADGDDANYLLTTNGLGSITLRTATCAATSSGLAVVTASGAAWNQNTSLTRYQFPAYNGGASATEADHRTEVQVAGTASRLGVNVYANTVTATSTLRLRVNGANGNQSVSIASSATGQMEDASGSDTLAATDELNYSLVTGASGTSMQLRSPRFLLTVAAAANRARLYAARQAVNRAGTY